MHESGIIRALVHQIEAAALKAGGRQVTRVTVWLGALSQMSPDHFQMHFEEDARGTMVEGAALEIEASDDPTNPEAQSVVLRSFDVHD